METAWSVALIVKARDSRLMQSIMATIRAVWQWLKWVALLFRKACSRSLLNVNSERATISIFSREKFFSCTKCFLLIREGSNGNHRWDSHLRTSLYHITITKSIPSETRTHNCCQALELSRLRLLKLTPKVRETLIKNCNFVPKECPLWNFKNLQLYRCTHVVF